MFGGVFLGHTVSLKYGWISGLASICCRVPLTMPMPHLWRCVPMLGACTIVCSYGTVLPSTKACWMQIFAAVLAKMSMYSSFGQASINASSSTFLASSTCTQDMHKRSSRSCHRVVPRGFQGSYQQLTDIHYTHHVTFASDSCSFHTDQIQSSSDDHSHVRFTFNASVTLPTGGVSRGPLRFLATLRPAICALPG